MRARDTTTEVESLAAAVTRSGSPGAANNGVGRTTDSALRKLQENDPEFRKYDGNPEHFLPWFVAVEERKKLRQLSDQAAIIFATEALEGHTMGTMVWLRNMWVSRRCCRICETKTSCRRSVLDEGEV